MKVRNDEERRRTSLRKAWLQKTFLNSLSNQFVLAWLCVCFQKKKKNLQGIYFDLSPLTYETWGQVAFSPPKPMKRMTMMVARMMRTKMRMVIQDLCLSHHDLSASSKLSPPIRPTRASSSFCEGWSWSWWCWWQTWYLSKLLRDRRLEVTKFTQKMRKSRQ